MRTNKVPSHRLKPTLRQSGTSKISGNYDKKKTSIPNQFDMAAVLQFTMVYSTQTVIQNEIIKTCLSSTEHRSLLWQYKKYVTYLDWFWQLNRHFNAFLQSVSTWLIISPYGTHLKNTPHKANKD